MRPNSNFYDFLFKSYVKKTSKKSSKNEFFQRFLALTKKVKIF